MVCYEKRSCGIQRWIFDVFPVFFVFMTARSYTGVPYRNILITFHHMKEISLLPAFTLFRYQRLFWHKCNKTFRNNSEDCITGDIITDSHYLTKHMTTNIFLHTRIYRDVYVAEIRCLNCNLGSINAVKPRSYSIISDKEKFHFMTSP